MFGFEPIPALAGGTINPCRFIAQDTAADNQVVQAGANARVCGISTEAPRDAPIDGASGVAASLGDGNMMYNPEGNVCLLEIGSGGITRGAEIKSDTDGTGIAAATTGAVKQWVGAWALESAVQGELARVLVKIYPHYPALS